MFHHIFKGSHWMHGFWERKPQLTEQQMYYLAYVYLYVYVYLSVSAQQSESVAFAAQYITLVCSQCYSLYKRALDRENMLRIKRNVFTCCWFTFKDLQIKYSFAHHVIKEISSMLGSGRQFLRVKSSNGLPILLIYNLSIVLSLTQWTKW